MEQSDKKLPIRIFHTREVDSRATEGMGSNKPQRWFLTGDELLQSAVERENEIEEIKNTISFDSSGYVDVPQAISIEISEKAIAKSHRESIDTVFSDKFDRVPPIGFSPKNELLFSITAERHLLNAQSKFRAPFENQKTVSAIKKINKYRPHIASDINLEDNLKIKFINYKDRKVQKHIYQQFERYCERKQIEFKKCSYAPSLKIYKVNKITKDGLNEIAELDGILSIDAMPKYHITPDCTELSEKVSIKEPDPDKLYPTIGVLDSGIEKIRHLSPWIKGAHSSYDEDELDKSHGTFVAGLICYGKEFLSGAKEISSPCNIFDAAVMSDEEFGEIDEDELLDNIREVVELKGDEIKIWSLSLGTRKEASTDIFSEFGIALDFIQDRQGVLIVKSAGNCNNFENELPVSRISESADSIRSIVVGSIAHDKYETDLADKNCHSPFSRIGPAPQGIVKPELVHYGGNSGLSAMGNRLDNGVPSFTPDGEIATMCGTSFSTPQVAALIASLDYNLNGDFNSLLLKTLAIHNAQYPTGIEDKGLEKIHKYGFGMVSSVDQVLMNNEHEITMILQDNLPKGEGIEVLEFPFPQSLIDEDGYFTGEIIVTVVNKCLLDANQGREYCQSNLDVLLGTYDSIKSRDTTKSYIKNPIGKNNAHNILQPSLYSKKIKKGLNEASLIKNGKFHPVKKFHCDLSQLTPTNKDKCLRAPKSWFLKVEAQFRRNIEQIAEVDGKELSNKFCIAITIRDKEKENKIYNEVVQLLDNYNFLHQQVELREDVRVRHSI